jgi:hypothetical protein
VYWLTHQSKHIDTERYRQSRDSYEQLSSIELERHLLDALVVRVTYSDMMRGSEWFGRRKVLVRNASDPQQEKGSGRWQTYLLGEIMLNSLCEEKLSRILRRDVEF